MKIHLNFHPRRLAAVLAAVAALASCAKKQAEPQLLPPSFKFDRDDASYVVKVGREITISPVYDNVMEASYLWEETGKGTVCTDSVFTFSSDQTGDRFFSLTVSNAAGEAYKEFKISVVPLLVPVVSLNVPEGGYIIGKDTPLTLVPSVSLSDGVTYEWTVDAVKAADTKDFTFTSSKTGSYKLVFTATAEDGSASVEVPVKVVEPEDLPFEWTFEKDVYNLSSGRSVCIRICSVRNAADPEFIWTVSGEERQRGPETEFVFSDKNEGKYDVTVTMQSGAVRASRTLEVNVCPPEGTYRRSSSGAASCNRVYAYTPAPGQFINEEPVTTAEEACTFAMDRFGKNAYVSLGGFGGYIIVGFDHSIANDGDYNIQIAGNSFKGSSEPGIVWVMQDENGDGLPNDTWYELKGSEYGKGAEKRNYEVTYFRPSAPGMPVQWTDSEGNTGEIDYLQQFHPQDYYYPLWIEGDSYTLRGTCLPSKTWQQDNGFWVNDEYEWGYADNFSPVDRLTDDGNQSASVNANHFKISNAVTFDGRPADLKYIDFVMVVCGVNAKAGWLGEVSTEVFGVRDYNLIKDNHGSSEDFGSGSGIW